MARIPFFKYLQLTFTRNESHAFYYQTLTVEWNHAPEGEAAITRLMERNKFVKFGHIEMSFSREVVYVQDFLNDLRLYE